MKISKRVPMETKSFRITLHALEVLQALAAEYDTSQGDILNTMLTTAGKKILVKAQNARIEKALEKLA
jgi:hypothetical protein